jgi:hypothetical protein
MRFFLRELALFAAVIAAGAVALLYAIGANQHVGEPVVVERRAPSPLAESMDLLRHAPRFEAAAVGAGGMVPTSVVAWLTIARSPTADSLFRELLYTSTPAGRLYALAGLREVNAPLFTDAARHLRTTDIRVPTFSGCFVASERMNMLVRELERGEWVDGFLRADPEKYVGWRPWPQNLPQQRSSARVKEGITIQRM